VLDGDPVGTQPPTAAPPRFRPMPIVAKRSPISATAELLLWPPYVIGQAIMVLSCGFFYFLSIFFSSPNLSRRRLDVYHTSHTWCGLSANLRRRSETYVVRAARWKCRTQKIAKNSPSRHRRTTLSGYIFATKARIDNRKKTC